MGRSGCGKSSFAETLEQLLTGDTYRWAHPTREWRDGWRNLHHRPATIHAEFTLEGERASCVVAVHFFKQRRFLDEEDLQRQLREWVVEVNTVRASRATGVIPAERMKEERPRLRPLKVSPADLALRIPITVGPTGVVVHDTHEYSMPPDAMGIPGTLYLYCDRVRVVAGRYEATHPRLFGPPAKSTLPEHRAQRVAAAAGKRAKRYMQREHLLEVGREALEYLTELTHRRPRVWTRDVERLHDLLQRHGKDALRAAFTRGLSEQALGWEYIVHYLESPPPPRATAVQRELPL
jgi:hypothetical protein